MDLSSLIQQIASPLSTVQTAIGVAAFIFGLGAAWSNLRNSVRSLERTIKEEIKPVLVEVRERFSTVEDRVDSLWRDQVAPAYSRRALNSRGRTLLLKSGIRAIVDENQRLLETLFRRAKPAAPYDAERAAIAAVFDLPRHRPEVSERLKDGSFKIGADIDLVLLVGGIYFRDQVMQKGHLNRPTPSQRSISG